LIALKKLNLECILFIAMEPTFFSNPPLEDL
jgi:hypothetical protein